MTTDQFNQLISVLKSIDWDLTLIFVVFLVRVFLND